MIDICFVVFQSPVVEKALLGLGANMLLHLTFFHLFLFYFFLYFAEVRNELETCRLAQFHPQGRGRSQWIVIKISGWGERF